MYAKPINQTSIVLIDKANRPTSGSPHDVFAKTARERCSILIGFGHSHLTGLQYAYPGWSSLRENPLQAVFLQLLEPRFRFEGDPSEIARRQGKLLRQEIESELSSSQSKLPLVFTCFSGNEYHSYGMTNHQRPFDFVLPEKPDLPLNRSAEIIPYPAIERLIRSIVAPPVQHLKVMVATIDLPVVAVASPPPIPNSEYLIAANNAFHTEINKAGLSPPGLRYKLWYLQNKFFAEACAADRIGFLHPPENTMDSDGFILEHGWMQDGVHATPWYGHAVLDQLERLALYPNQDHA